MIPGLEKNLFPTALGKYKSQELGALSTVFVKQEPLLRKSRAGGVGGGEEGEQSPVLGALAVWEGPKDGGEGLSYWGLAGLVHLAPLLFYHCWVHTGYPHPPHCSQELWSRFMQM